MSSSHFIYAIAHFCNISMAEFHPLYISLLVSDRVDALECSPKRSLHLTACVTELQLDFCCLLFRNCLAGLPLYIVPN